MKLHWKIIDQKVPEPFVTTIKKDISFAFDLEGTGQTIINPTKFFKMHPDGKLKAIVMNQAEFLSKGFQKRLVDAGWAIEETLNKQTIDGFSHLSEELIESASLTKDNFVKILNELDLENPHFLDQISSYYKNFYKRNCFNVDSGESKEYFSIKPSRVRLKVGLEFETGNIASSFRAISKLNVLYNKSYIDVGIFITSYDKSVSTRIWPSSNRNGSIEELNNRKFLEQIQFPLILIGFEPDVWDGNASFLKRDGTRYSLDGMTTEKTVLGKKYIYHNLKKIYELVE